MDATALIERMQPLLAARSAVAVAWLFGSAARGTMEQDGSLPAGTVGRFAPLFAFRNRGVHLYDRVDTRRVYEILTTHRHDLAALLDLLLAIPD